MMVCRFLLSTALALALVPLAKADPMLPCSRLVVFCDGLSDRGRRGPLTGYRHSPGPPLAEGRWTGGPTGVEHHATLSGVALAAGDNHAMGGWRKRAMWESLLPLIPLAAPALAEPPRVHSVDLAALWKPDVPEPQGAASTTRARAVMAPGALRPPGAFRERADRGWTPPTAAARDADEAQAD